MNNNLSIMLWNARSILSNLGEFQKRLDEDKPHIVCLTETWLKPDKNISFKKFNIFRLDRINQGGGIAILVRKEIEVKPLPANTYNGGKLEYMGVELKLENEPLNLLLFYNPPGTFTEEEIDHYISSVNGKKIVCGDFNARHPSWDSNGRNSAGNILHEYIIESPNISLFTPPDLPTRYNPVNNKYSTIDLFMGSSSLLPDCKVSIGPDTGTSDHHPTTLQLVGQLEWNTIRFRGKWKIDDKLWPSWINKAKSLTFAPITDLSESILLFVSALILISSNIFKHSTGTYSPKLSAPWWNEECSLARANRRKAKRTLKRHNSLENLCAYKRAVAASKRIIRTTKKKYWRDFCGQLSVQTPLDKVWRVF